MLCIFKRKPIHAGLFHAPLYVSLGDIPEDKVCVKLKPGRKDDQRGWVSIVAKITCAARLVLAGLHATERLRAQNRFICDTKQIERFIVVQGRTCAH